MAQIKPSRTARYELGRTLSSSTGACLFAHTPPLPLGDWHSWADHARAVASLAAEFGEGFGAAGLCELAGLLHDAGKVTAEVQQALIRCAREGGGRLGTPHKLEGAALAAALTREGPPNAATVLAMSLFGHHSGIPDFNSESNFSALHIADQVGAHPEWLMKLGSLIETELGIDFKQLVLKLTLPTFVRTDSPFSIELFTRMCHSALVDADFLDTASHFEQASSPWTNPDIGMPEILERFRHGYCQRFSSAPDTPTTRLRRELFDAATTAGRESSGSGIFRLAAPTGAGKTMSMMSFAMEHAVSSGKKRIIMAVPFTSITTQNSQALRTVLGDDLSTLVLEHHSAVENHPESEDWWRRLSAQNWDAEIVVTTTVQLFESLFSNRPSATRKLHRVANSVLIIDEVQALPLLLVPSILRILRELTDNYGVSVVLSSATQPSFWSLAVWEGLPVTDLYRPHRDAKDERVSFDIRPQEQSWEIIADEIAGRQQALAIVNTTSDARRLFELVQERTETRTLHLSTRMCSAHRAQILAQVKDAAASGQPVILVSTQLVEAGVDLDFPVVYRALAPADSILQAAGRCNREGRLDGPGRVVVFRVEGGQLPGALYRQATELTDAHLKRYGDFGSPNFMRHYYDELYEQLFRGTGSELSRSVDRSRHALQFAETASKFRMIDDVMRSVIVTTFGSVEEQSAVAEMCSRLRRLPSQALRPEERRLLTRYTSQVPASWINPSLVAPLTSDLHEWVGEYDPNTGAIGEAPAGVSLW